jgi:hypothetical protein
LEKTLTTRRLHVSRNAVFAFLLVVAAGLCLRCSPRSAAHPIVTHATAQPPIPQNQKSKMTPPTVMFPSLDRWLQNRSLDQATLHAQLRPNDKQESAERSYQKLNPTTWICNPEVDPAHYHFQEGRVVMIYLSAPSVVDSLDPKTFDEVLGMPAPDHDLQCRVGKRARQYVYPEAGIAYALEDGKVRFLEIFPPCNMAEYLARIYIQPEVGKL